MTIIRDDDAERIARVEHVIETIKRRREELAVIVHESEQVCEESAKMRDAARAASTQLRETNEGSDEAS